MLMKRETDRFHVATAPLGGRRDTLEMIGACGMLPMLVLLSRRVIRRLDPTERSSLDKAVVKS